MSPWVPLSYDTFSDYPLSFWDYDSFEGNVLIRYFVEHYSDVLLMVRQGVWIILEEGYKDKVPFDVLF